MNPSPSADITKNALLSQAPQDGIAALAEAATKRVLGEQEVLITQGEESQDVFFVVDGCLQVAATHQGKTQIIGHINADQWVGEMSLGNVGRRTATVTAREASTLLRLSRQTFDAFLSTYPAVALAFDALMRQRKPLLALREHPLFDSLSVEILHQLLPITVLRHLKTGEALMQQGEPADGMYVVLSGRLQVLVDSPSTTSRVVSELGRGEIVGEMALIMEGRRSATVRALRPSELLQIPGDAFRQLSETSPEVLRPLSHILAERLLVRNDSRRRISKKSCVAIVSDPEGPDPLAFAHSLAPHLRAQGEVQIVDAQRVDQIWGPGASLEPRTSHRSKALSAWILEQEERTRFVLLVGTPERSPWTALCLEHADRILRLTTASHDPAITALDRCLDEHTTQVGVQNVEIVLQHPRALSCPRGTRHWLQPRSCLRHHHMRIGEEPDVARIARFLTNQARGLVLSGGGSLGFAHLGALRALQEANVDIDLIGGVSAGAWATYCYGQGGTIEEVTQRMKEICSFRTMVRPTLPLFSMVNPRPLEDVLARVVPHDIEDQWIPSFSMAVSLTHAKTIVHQRGSAAHAARCSSALPGSQAPVFDQGEVVVDGAVYQNMPVSVMEQLCPGTVMACDCIGDQRLRAPASLQRCPTPWQYLWSRLNPFARTLDVPLLPQLCTSSFWGTHSQNRQAVAARCEMLFTPALDTYSMGDMGKRDEIFDIGYRHACEQLASRD